MESLFSPEPFAPTQPSGHRDRKGEAARSHLNRRAAFICLLQKRLAGKNMRLGGLEKMWSLTPPFLGTFRPSFLTFLPKERWSWALRESGRGRDSESSCWEEMLCARAAPHCTSWFLRCFFSVVAVAVEPCMGCEICGESRANPAAALGKKKMQQEQKMQQDCWCPDTASFVLQHSRLQPAPCWGRQRFAPDLPVPPCSPAK